MVGFSIGVEGRYLSRFVAAGTHSPAAREWSAAVLRARPIVSTASSSREPAVSRNPAGAATAAGADWSQAPSVVTAAARDVADILFPFWKA